MREHCARMRHWWRAHTKLLMLLGMIVWIVTLAVLHHRLNGPSRATLLTSEGIVATVLPVGGLPVT